MTNTYPDYPKRGYGNDHDRYDWSYSALRDPRHSASGDKVEVMVIIPLEFFPLNPSGRPFKHPGAMVTPYPDLRHFSTRDYGNRVGVYRLLEVLETTGIRAVFPVNAALLNRCTPLIDRIRKGGHEIAAHGVSTDHIHFDGLSLDEETAFVSETVDCFKRHGLKPGVWMSPARNQSFRTPDILTQFGFDICLDWEMDQIPVRMKTSNGDLVCLPNHSELNDFNILLTKRQSEDEWRDQIIESASFLKEEAESTGTRVLGFTLTPYVSGLPFRISALQDMLGAMKAQDGVGFYTASEISDAWIGV